MKQLPLFSPPLAKPADQTIALTWFARMREAVANAPDPDDLFGKPYNKKAK